MITNCLGMRLDRDQTLTHEKLRYYKNLLSINLLLQSTSEVKKTLSKITESEAKDIFGNSQYERIIKKYS